MKRSSKEDATRAHMKKMASRMKQYEKMTFLERYGIFMAKAQIVEMLLKQNLIDERDYKLKAVENCPLGPLIKLLKKEKINGLLLFCLKDLCEHRNYLAHEFLANQILLMAILEERADEYSKPSRQLQLALLSVEQFLLNYEAVPAKLRWMIVD